MEHWGSHCMTVKEFDVQIALGLIPFDFKGKTHQIRAILADIEFELVLKLEDKEYSSRDYHWMRTLLYTDVNIPMIRSTLIEAGILIL